MTDNSNSSSNINYAEQLLQKLKASFLEDMSERCNEMELLALSLDHKDDVYEIYDELYRKIHSLKGIAGTHGISLISTICHHFEGWLASLGENLRSIDKEFIGVCLGYVDLIKNTSNEAARTKPDYIKLESKLEKIRKKILDNNLIVLVVESSPMMAELYENSISGLPVKTIVIDNGLQALDRLLHERFDFLITGNSLKTLNGVALISALKASESLNSNIQTVMVASTTDIKFPAGIKPDYLIQRSPELAGELAAVVNKLTSRR